MKPLFAITACLIVFCSLVITQAQTQTAQPASNSPVAYIYVSSGSTNSYTIEAYAAAANGALSRIPGSPFATDSVTALAVKPQWLFGANGIYIYSFFIAPNGALQQKSSINAQQYNGYADGGPVTLFLDRTAATLYDLDIYGNNAANNTYQFFTMNSDGALNYISATTSASPEFMTALSFIGTNKYGYGSSNYHGYQNIYGFARGSDGSLTDLNLNAPIPAAPKGAYGPFLAAADDANHVAVSFTPTDDLTVVGPTQLAVYSADASGNLTTTNTWQTMPISAVGAYDMKISPSGKLLAVGGPAGLQIFHFNGGDPITKFTGPLNADSIGEVCWDSSNHLYAIGGSGKLYVFNVTPTSVRPAPGSPYSVPNPWNVVALSK